MDADNSSTELHGKWLQANRPRPTMVRWNFAQGPFGVCVPNDGQQGVQHAGGRGGIRTHGTLAGTPVFKTGALNHSATLPNHCDC